MAIENVRGYVRCYIPKMGNIKISGACFLYLHTTSYILNFYLKS